MSDSVRIAAWNVNSLKVRLPQVLRWLGEQEKAKKPIDALCLQELKLTDDKYPHKELEEAGYFSLAAGQKTYNGVAIIESSTNKTTIFFILFLRYFTLPGASLFIHTKLKAEKC